MTEQEWLMSGDAEAMLKFVKARLKVARTKEGRRKLRMFGAACFRSYVEHERKTTKKTDLAILRAAVEVAEHYADGLADKAVLCRTREKARRQLGSKLDWLLSDDPQEAWRASRKYYLNDPTWPYEATDQRRAAMMREVFGNPFHPIEVSPQWKKWNDGVALKLARAVYDERQLPKGILDPTRLTVLADALEDAGCTHSEILAHLRGPGPHVRGCWAVDLLLDKK